MELQRSCPLRCIRLKLGAEDPTIHDTSISELVEGENMQTMCVDDARRHGFGASTRGGAPLTTPAFGLSGSNAVGKLKAFFCAEAKHSKQTDLPAIAQATTVLEDQLDGLRRSEFGCVRQKSECLQPNVGVFDRKRAVATKLGRFQPNLGGRSANFVAVSPACGPFWSNSGWYILCGLLFAAARSRMACACTASGPIVHETTALTSWRSKRPFSNTPGFAGGFASSRTL